MVVFSGQDNNEPVTTSTASSVTVDGALRFPVKTRIRMAYYYLKLAFRVFLRGM